MKTAFAAILVLASAVPAFAQGDGDNANRVRASIYETVLANQMAQFRSTAIAQRPATVPARTAPRRQRH